MMYLRMTLFAIAAFAGAAGAVSAAELRIGRANEPQSMDPQFARTGNNQMTAMHIFDRLVVNDENIRTTPGLAASWRNIDPRTWEVRLRANVKFHDGSIMSAEDVVFSMERAPNVPNSPASFADSVKSIEKMQIVDPLTIRFTTTVPDPLFMDNIGTVFILSKKAAEKASNADFNSGKAAIGTGAYKFVSWAPGDRLQLTRNEDYWGPKPDFDKVTLRFISNDAARVAALLSKSVDVIDLVPPADLPRLKKDPNLRVVETATVRLVYLALNLRRPPPYVTDETGSRPLGNNPFSDARVRKALSLMIDRKALVSRILQGSGEPAAQLVPAGVFGYNPALKVPAADIQEARRLLREAGYENGFGVTLHGSNDRFLLDREVTQAMGQFLARGGIKVNKVETLPYSVYSKDALRGAYGMFIFSYGNSTGEASRGLESLLHTVDRERNLGSLNRTLYTNPAFDKAISQAMQEFDPKKREKMLQDAATLIYNDTAFVPLYWQSLAWASRKGVNFKARRDERTLAMSASIAK
jgi:peptide/nickel transport system substrate-binding protein